VAIDVSGSVPVKKFMAKQGYSFQVLLDSKNEVLDLYRVERIPTSFLIDRKGRIAGKALGPRNWRSPEAITLLNWMIEGTGHRGAQDRPIAISNHSKMITSRD
jgi:peroxiredoxin